MITIKMKSELETNDMKKKNTFEFSLSSDKKSSLKLLTVLNLLVKVSICVEPYMNTLVYLFQWITRPFI